MINGSPDLQLIKQQVAGFLQEDIGSGDVTAAIITPTSGATSGVIAREAMVVCGQPWFNQVFQQLDGQVDVQWQVEEGDFVQAGTHLVSVSGLAPAILTGERTALNLLQTLSATASISKRYADAVAGTGCKVLDTRKTLPGLRLAQKYAVRCGGCFNHRIGLYDGILIKENHIMAAGSIQAAVQTARASSTVSIEVEVENLEEFAEAKAAQPDRIMLDNFSIEDLKFAVQNNEQHIDLEASGDINLNTIRQVAETGVDYISIGALTKHIQAIDLSMRINLWLS